MFYILRTLFVGPHLLGFSAKKCVNGSLSPFYVIPVLFYIAVNFSFDCAQNRNALILDIFLIFVNVLQFKQVKIKHSYYSLMLQSIMRSYMLGCLISLRNPPLGGILTFEHVFPPLVEEKI
jgi:predicted Kef-type K+ transport protein